jgi:murein DD-endopeptidase MepM/ murein hydrolase activator NlpD
MRGLAILVLGIVIGIALVLVPLERGWLAPGTLVAALHGERAAPPAPAPRVAPTTPAAPAVVTGTAPFGGTAPQPLPPPPLPTTAGEPAAVGTLADPHDAAPAAPVGNATQTPPPSSAAASPAALPLPPGTPPLLVPVRGVNASQLSDTFTQSRGEGRRHDAIDILAPRGTPVLAVADGRIEKLFLSKPGGRTIYQFDPTGRVAYYYAHLDAYAPLLSEGSLVKRGQVIGYVGSTGNASPEAPHLHFAIFELGPEKRWWQGTAVNPYPLLGGG